MNRIITSILIAFLLATGVACNSKPAETDTAETEIFAATRISFPGLAASCPYLTKDNHGNTVLSWVQATDTTGNYLMAYAVSADGGKTFAEPQLIPATSGVYPHDENLSKILFRENGDIIAMFAVSNPSEQNMYAGLVYYTQSFDGGKSWSDPRQLSEHAEHSIDERYFDMELLPDGEVAAIWLDSRKDSEKEGSSLYFASTSGRGGFGGEKVIDSQLCQCCRTDLYLDDQKNLHVAYRGILNDSIRDMMYLMSADGGKSFSRPERISTDNWVIYGCPHTGPTMAANKHGMHYAWFTMGGGSGVYYSQKQAGAAFTPREAVSTAPAARHPQMAVLGSGKLVIVWDERHAQAGKPGNRVGLQVRSESGAFISSRHITPDSISAVYPVISPINRANLLVAYSIKRDNPGEIWYQLLTIQD